MQKYSSCDLVYCVPEKNESNHFILLGRFFKVNISKDEDPIVDVIAFSTAIVSEDDLQHVDSMVRDTLSEPLYIFLNELANISLTCVGDECYFDEFVKRYSVDSNFRALDIKRDVCISKDEDPMVVLKPVPGGALTFFVPKLPKDFA